MSKGDNKVIIKLSDKIYQNSKKTIVTTLYRTV